MDTRRGFLTSAVALCAAVGIPDLIAQQSQEPRTAPVPTPKSQPLAQEPEEKPTLPSPDKGILEANEKDIKKKVQQLYKLAGELKDEVEKTDSSKVLSVALLKKTEEIEKLAKDIRNKSRAY